MNLGRGKREKEKKEKKTVVLLQFMEYHIKYLVFNKKCVGATPMNTTQYIY